MPIFHASHLLHVLHNLFLVLLIVLCADMYLKQLSVLGTISM